MTIAPNGLVLVTRPQPAAAATAKRLTDLGRTPLVVPLLEIAPRAASLPDPTRLQAVLATSANAIPALAACHARPLLTVGDATADIARAAGFRTVFSAGSDAAGLAELAARCCRPAGPPLLLARGAGQGRPLAQTLRAHGFRVIQRVVYAVRTAASLPAPLRIALDQGAIATALFFSPATAVAFVRLVRAERPVIDVSSIEALAISPAAAAALSPLPWRRIRVASRPNQDELLALLA